MKTTGEPSAGTRRDEIGAAMVRRAAGAVADAAVAAAAAAGAGAGAGGAKPPAISSIAWRCAGVIAPGRSLELSLSVANAAT